MFEYIKTLKKIMSLELGVSEATIQKQIYTVRVIVVICAEYCAEKC